MTDLPEPVAIEVLALTAELAEVAPRLDALAQRYAQLTPAAAVAGALVTLMAEAAGIEVSGPA